MRWNDLLAETDFADFKEDKPKGKEKQSIGTDRMPGMDAKAKTVSLQGEKPVSNDPTKKKKPVTKKTDEKKKCLKNCTCAKCKKDKDEKKKCPKNCTCAKCKKGKKMSLKEEIMKSAGVLNEGVLNKEYSHYYRTGGRSYINDKQRYAAAKKKEGGGYNSTSNLLKANRASADTDDGFDYKMYEGSQKKKPSKPKPKIPTGVKFKDIEKEIATTRAKSRQAAEDRATIKKARKKELGDDVGGENQEHRRASKARESSYKKDFNKYLEHNKDNMESGFDSGVPDEPKKKKKPVRESKLSAGGKIKESSLPGQKKKKSKEDSEWDQRKEFDDFQDVESAKKKAAVNKKKRDVVEESFKYFWY